MKIDATNVHMWVSCEPDFKCLTIYAKGDVESDLCNSFVILFAVGSMQGCVSSEEYHPLARLLGSCAGCMRRQSTATLGHHQPFSYTPRP